MLEYAIVTKKRLQLLANNRGGALVNLLLFVVLLAAVGGVAFLYFEHRKEAYAEETTQLAIAISRSVGALDAGASAQEIRQTRSMIDDYRARDDADSAASERWLAEVSDWDAQLIEREEQLSKLLERARNFPTDGSLGELEKLDAEIQSFAEALDAKDQERISSVWGPRKRQVQAKLNSVSATLIVRTVPSGAATYLDGEYVGTSSLGIQNVRGGKHVLALEKNGYVRKEQEIVVSESGQIDIGPVELTAISSPVRIVVTGGRKRDALAVSLEKSAGENEDVLLFFEEIEGRDVVFENAPSGRLKVTVMSGARVVVDTFIEVGTDQKNVFEFSIE